MWRSCRWSIGHRMDRNPIEPDGAGAVSSVSHTARSTVAGTGAGKLLPCRGPFEQTQLDPAIATVGGIQTIGVRPAGRHTGQEFDDLVGVCHRIDRKLPLRGRLAQRRRALQLRGQQDARERRDGVDAVGAAAAQWQFGIGKDFVDAGLPSTVCEETVYREAFDTMISRIASCGAEVLVVPGDLTRDEDRVRRPIMGRTWSYDAPRDLWAMSQFNTITSLSQSPLVEGLIYAGTDDGLIQITEDGGANWRTINKLPGVPNRFFVNDIKADLHDPDTVYVVVDDHKSGDFSPYVLRSTDRGENWESITGDLPDGEIVYSLMQDHVTPELLFAAARLVDGELVVTLPDGSPGPLEGSATAIEDPTRRARLELLDRRYAGWLPGLYARAGDAIARAEAVFEGPAAAMDWLSSPNAALEGATPLSLLDTDIGAEGVMDTLGRIEHGVFA